MGLFNRKKPSRPALPAPLPAAVPCQVCGQAVRENLMAGHRREHFEIISDTGLQPGLDTEAYRDVPASKPRQTAVYLMRARYGMGMDSEIALVAAFLARSYPRDTAIQYLPRRRDLVSEVLIIVHY